MENSARNWNFTIRPLRICKNQNPNWGNEMHKILWNFEIQTVHLRPARRFEYIEKRNWGVGNLERIITIHTAALVRSSTILRWVLETWRTDHYHSYCCIGKIGYNTEKSPGNLRTNHYHSYCCIGKIGYNTEKSPRKPEDESLSFILLHW